MHSYVEENIGVMVAIRQVGVCGERGLCLRVLSRNVLTSSESHSLD